MKSSSVVALACMVASASAFAPSAGVKSTGALFATKPVASGPPESSGYPSFADAASKVKFSISGGGNKAPRSSSGYPDFSNPAKQVERDPEFYKAAAKTRGVKNQDFAFEDGLTVLEQAQRRTTPLALTGSAKSQADLSTIRDDIVVDEYAFGLSADRFQLLFITVFGLFTLVGCLSGNLKF
uniref:Uncharacterized protein n=1 Tax=Ditylum brightwellii TaxID=49249 RepID=A0A7S1VX31_9STRA|mmetsp:Transcript_10593/g.15731  ORF Transcript_10593/g.15731 Transcript_10593/m.15731 type:complete len:182 (+) Transcript_10593:134-679(+)